VQSTLKGPIYLEPWFKIQDFVPVGEGRKESAGVDDDVMLYKRHVAVLGKLLVAFDLLTFLILTYLDPGRGPHLALRLIFNHAPQRQVVFSGLFKQEGETFTSLSDSVADQA